MHLRKPSPSVVIASLALFFALGGTAIAAHRYLITSTSQIKPSVLTKLESSAGKNGAAPISLSPISINAGPVVKIPVGKLATATATCPSGSDAVSGSAWTGYGIRGTEGMAENHQAWIVGVINESRAEIEIHVDVYCAASGQAVSASVARASTAREAGRITAKLAKEQRANRH